MCWRGECTGNPECGQVPLQFSIRLSRWRAEDTCHRPPCLVRMLRPPAPWCQQSGRSLAVCLRQRSAHHCTEAPAGRPHRRRRGSGARSDRAANSKPKLNCIYSYWVMSELLCSFERSIALVNFRRGSTIYKSRLSKTWSCSCIFSSGLRSCSGFASQASILRASEKALEASIIAM